MLRTFLLRRSVVFALALVFGLPVAIHAQPNTPDTYTGSATGNVTTDGNWSLTTVPTVSNDAIFNALPGIRNFGSGATVADLTVGSFNVTATSGTYTLRNDTTSATNVTLTLGGPGNLGNGVSGNAADLLFAASGSTFNITGPNGNGGTGTLILALGQSGNFNISGTSAISAVISGSTFGFTKTGAGTLTVSGTNTYSGDTILSNGILSISNINALGSGASAVKFTGGTLNLGFIAATTSILNTLTVANGQTGFFTVTGSGVAANTLTIGTGAITINGTLRFTRPTGNTGATNFSTALTGSGTVEIGNTNGGTTPSSTAMGRSQFTNASAFTNFSGAIHVLNGGNLCFFNATQSTTNQALTIDSGGYISLIGSTSTSVNTNFGGLNGAGEVIRNSAVNSTSTLTIGNGNGSGSFSGIIRGNNAVEGVGSPGIIALVKVGTGTQSLSGASTYIGSTTISNGALIAGTNSPSGLAGAFGAASTAINLGDANSITNNLSPSLLINGAFSVGRNITVGANSSATSGIYTLGGNAVATSTFSGVSTLNQSLSVTQVVGGTLNLTGNIISGDAGTQTVTFNNLGTVVQSTGVIGGGAGTIAVTQAGTGSTTFNNTQTYTGATTVTAGRLYVNGSLDAASTVSVANFATLGGTGTVNGTATVVAGGIIEAGQNGVGSLTLGGLTFSGNGTINVGTLANYSATTATQVNGLLTTTGANSIAITLGSLTGIAFNTPYKILSYSSIGGTGFAAFAQPMLPNRATGSLNNTGSEINLTITGTDFIKWTGTAGTTWNTTVSNWKLSSSNAPANYINTPPDVVVFDNNAGATHNTVDINAATVSPNSVTFDNSNFDYLLQGAFGIAGSTGLTKTGTGLLTITNTNNSYTGVTAIKGGTINFVSGGLGTGTITFGGIGGTLQYAATNTQDVSARIKNSTNVMAVDTGVNSIPFAGVIDNTNTGGLTKIGAGTLTLSAANTYTGDTIINGGTLSITNVNALGSGSSAVMFTSGSLNLTSITTITNTLTVASGQTGFLDVTGSGALTIGTGAIAIDGTLRVTRLAGGVGGTNFSAAVTGAGTLEIGNTQSGNALSPTNQGRSQFTNTNAFTGFTGSFHVLSGANLCLFNATQTTLNQNLTIDAGGFVTILNATTNFGGLNGGGDIARNSAVGTTAVLTLGNGDANGNFTGVIRGNNVTDTTVGGQGIIALVKIGTGTQILSGANIYTGGTTLTAGVLAANTASPNSATGTGAVNVNGGILQGTGNIAGSIVLNGGTIAPGDSTNAGVLTTGAMPTFTTGSFNVNLSGGSFNSSQLAISTVTPGTLALGNNIVLNVIPYTGGSNPDHFTLISNPTGTAVTGAFSNFAENTVVFSNLGTDYVIHYGTPSDPGSVVLSAVPEPTMILAIGGLAVGVFVRRKKMRQGK